MQSLVRRNSEGVRHGCRDVTPSGLAALCSALFPRVAKANPGLKLANAFSVEPNLNRNREP